ncbi:MAG: ABC transporter ATP-binding protein [Bacteroidales bacterium]|nr:ABC transporter ATP-binding protein [Bacteroidales bacterium]
MEILKAENVCLRSKDKIILDNVNLSMQEGDFTCLIGKNGSGKTSLMKCMSRLMRMNEGSVSVFGKNIEEYSRKELSQKVSVVLQDNNNNLNFKVYDVVLMGRTPYKKLWQKDIEEDFLLTENALKSTNTLHLKDKPYFLLSSGEKQRVLIARALCQNTPIIFLDEPVSNLDIKHQFEIMDILKEINSKEKRSIFLILHDLSLCLQYTDKVIALKDGRVEYSGCTKEVLQEEKLFSLFDIHTQIIDNKYIILKH